MGIVRIQIRGSFGNKPDVEFSAMEGGHAYALSRAIAALAAELPSAIQIDHELHDDAQHPPESAFGTPKE